MVDYFVVFALRDAAGTKKVIDRIRESRVAVRIAFQRSIFAGSASAVIATDAGRG
jgi:hypothetical protein